MLALSSSFPLHRHISQKNAETDRRAMREAKVYIWHISIRKKLKKTPCTFQDRKWICRFENEVILHVKTTKTHWKIVTSDWQWERQITKMQMWKAVQQDTVKNDFEQYVYKEWKKVLQLSGNRLAQLPCCKSLSQRTTGTEFEITSSILISQKHKGNHKLERVCKPPSVPSW